MERGREVKGEFIPRLWPNERYVGKNSGEK